MSDRTNRSVRPNLKAIIIVLARDTLQICRSRISYFGLVSQITTVDKFLFNILIYTLHRETRLGLFLYLP